MIYYCYVFYQHSRVIFLLDLSQNKEGTQIIFSNITKCVYFSQKSNTESISMDKMPGKHGEGAPVNRIAVSAVMADPYVTVSAKMNGSSTSAC